MKEINTDLTLLQYIDYIIENDVLKSEMYDFVLEKGQSNIQRLKYMLQDVTDILFCRYGDYLELEETQQRIEKMKKLYKQEGWKLPVVKQWTLKEHIEYVKQRPDFNSLPEKQQNKRIEFVKQNHRDIIIDTEKLAGYDWEYHPVRMLKQCLTEEIERLTGTKPDFSDTIKKPFSDNLLQALETEKLIVKEPLQWVGAKNLCAYFVDCYFHKHLNNKWKTAETLFNTSNLRQAHDLYQNNKIGKPKNYELIDKIIQQNR